VHRIGGLVILSLLVAASACTFRSPAPLSPVGAQPAAAPVLATWQVEWDRTLAAARQEGKVVVWGPIGDVIRKNMTEAWRKAFPDIAMEWTGTRGSEIAGRLQAERNSGIYAVDLFMSGTTTANNLMKPMGALDPIRPALILPEVLDTASWLDHRIDFSDRDEMDLVFITVPKVNLIFDPNQVRAEEVDELVELLDPKWKDKIVVNDPTIAGSGQASMRWIWQVLGPERATEYITATRAQAAAVDRDERRQIEWIARGRYPILLGVSDNVVKPLMDQGVRVGVVVDFKEHGTSTTPSAGSLMLFNNAPNPNAARVFVNWLLSKDGQTVYSTSTDQASRRLDVPTDHLPAFAIPKPGVNYWASYTEENVRLPTALDNLLKDLYR
jgi:ABC-type Fe3+ transport system substrate-binding protein